MPYHVPIYVNLKNGVTVRTFHVKVSAKSCDVITSASSIAPWFRFGNHFFVLKIKKVFYLLVA